jgi:hypothetical protein
MRRWGRHQVLRGAVAGATLDVSSEDTAAAAIAANTPVRRTDREQRRNRDARPDRVGPADHAVVGLTLGVATGE